MLLEVTSLTNFPIIMMVMMITSFLMYLHSHDTWVLAGISTTVYFSRTSLVVDISSVNIDRFLCLYWDLEYKGKVTLPKTILVIIVGKLLAIGLTVGNYFTSKMDKKEQIMNMDTLEFILLSVNQYFLIIPVVATIMVVLTVTSYAIYIVFTLEKKISPNSTLPRKPKVFTVDEEGQNENNARENPQLEQNESMTMCRINIKTWTNNWVESQPENSQLARKILGINVVTLTMCLLNVPFLVLVMYLQGIVANHDNFEISSITISIWINITFLLSGLLFFAYFYLTEKRLNQYLNTIVL